MKRTVSRAVFGMFVFSLTLYGARAGTQQADSTAKGQKSHSEWMNPDRQLDRMSKALNLTDEQKSQIKPILEDRNQRIESLRADSSLSREDRRSKMRGIFEDTQNKIRAVLNDEQKQKLDQMHQRMRDRRKEHAGGGDDENK